MPEIGLGLETKSIASACFGLKNPGIVTETDHRNGRSATEDESSKAKKQLHLYASAFNIQRVHQRQRIKLNVLCYVHFCVSAFMVQQWCQTLRRMNKALRYAHLYIVTVVNKQWLRSQVSYKEALVTKIVRERRLGQKTIATIDNYLILKSVVKIQEWYRAQLKGRRIIGYAKNFNAALILQRQFRTRRKIRAIERYVVFHKSALSIQRCYKTKKGQDMWINVATIIQSWYRRNKKVMCISRYLAVSGSAAKVQRWFRLHLIRNRAQVLAAVKVIENWYSTCVKLRGLQQYLATHSRSYIKTNYKEYWKYARVYHLQRRYNSTATDEDREERKFLLQCLKMDAAALVIQSWHRKCKRRNKVTTHVNNGCSDKRNNNSLPLQRWRAAFKLVRKNIREEKSKRETDLTDAEVCDLVSQKAYEAWSAIKRTAAVLGESLQSWFFSKSTDIETGEVESIDDSAAHSECVYKVTRKQMCPSCVALKLSYLQPKIRLATNIFVSETSVMIIQRWWQRMKAANAILKEADRLKVIEHIRRR